MSVHLTNEELQKFYNNGINNDDIQMTVNLYRQEGINDDEIRQKIDLKLSSFEQSEPQKQEKRGINLTPSGLVKQGLAGALAPVRAGLYNQTVPEAYNTGIERLENFKPLHGAGDFLVDTAGYAALPVLRGAKGATLLGNAGRFAGNALIQGGVPGALEGLKEGELGNGARTGTGLAVGVQSLPLIGKVAKPAAQIIPATGNFIARTLGRVQPETLKRAVQADSKALDLTKEQAQNLLMNTTERIQKDYQNLMDNAGRAVNEATLRLPEDRGVFASSLKNSLDDIYALRSVSGEKELNPAYDVAGDIYDDLINKINTATDVPEIGRVSAPKLADIMGTVKNYPINWQTSTAKDRQNILKQIYGDFSRRLGNLSPELRKANREYSKLAKFDDNEGLKQIINPDVIGSNKIDSASRALRNYNSTVTKGNTNRNIQDLEELLVANGKQPFLKDIDDVNAAMDLLNARSTGDSWLANATTQLARPALKGVRFLNQQRVPEKVAYFNKNISPKIRRLLTPLAVRGTVPTLYGGISND